MVRLAICTDILVFRLYEYPDILSSCLEVCMGQESPSDGPRSICGYLDILYGCLLGCLYSQFVFSIYSSNYLHNLSGYVKVSTLYTWLPGVFL